MFLSPQWTLLTGILLSFLVKDRPQLQLKAKVYGSTLLQLSVVLLGASLNFHSVLQDGATGALITATSIALIFVLGLLGIKILKLDKQLGLLVTAGTAICGGSAIGALAPVISAEASAITISMAIVFLLNGLSVYLFPFLGKILTLSQSDFGILSALAIHDTSSVVAASSIYGKEALLTATTLKLTRALWIVPLTLIVSLLQKRQEKKLSIPWFILGFLLVSLAFTFLPTLHPYKDALLVLSKTGFAITLFFIGLTFDFNKIKATGLRPLLFAVILWLTVIGMSLLYISIK